MSLDLQGYIDNIKLQLTGGVLDLELTDETLAQLVNAALREVQRYIASTKIITIPYKACIDLTDYKVSSVSRVFRADGYVIANSDIENSAAYTDPMYLGMWQMMSGNGNAFGISDWSYNYGAWNTALQIRNTLSTDLIFRFDKSTNKLYINVAFDVPDKITIEYVPYYTDVSQVTSDFWVDILMKLSLALAKVTIGRIRTKFTQTNSLWNLDSSILEEGQQELNSIRELMRNSTQLTYGID